MKRFLSRMNRGLALGTVLVLALAVYFFVDARAFDAEVYQVRDMLLAFVEEAEALNRGFSREANAAFAERFITEHRQAHWHPDVWSLRQNVENALEGFLMRLSEFVVEEVAFTLLEISHVRKVATHGVQVEFVMGSTFSPTEVMEAAYFNGLGTTFVFRGHGLGEPYTVTATLLRDGFGGDWRFASAQMRQGNMHFTAGW